VKIRMCPHGPAARRHRRRPDRRFTSSLHWHFSGYDRKQHDAGRCNYIPMNFGEAPDYYAPLHRIDRRRLHQDVPDDEHGYFNFSGATAYTKAMTERAKVVIVETSTALPYALAPRRRSRERRSRQRDRGRQRAARGAAEPAADGGRSQGRCAHRRRGPRRRLSAVGIGGMPKRRLRHLEGSRRARSRIHTEMLVDGMLDLVEAGIVTGARKTIDRYQIVYTFALGSQRQYRFIDRNPRMQRAPRRLHKLPHVIMQNERVISINNTTEIDLQGQAASESAGHRHLTGTGGRSSSCAAPTPRRAASRSSACRRCTTRAARRAAGSSRP